MHAFPFKQVIFISFIIVLCGYFFTNCNDSLPKEAPISLFVKPDYKDILISVQPDTLHFSLNDSTYNEIKAVNMFVDHGKEFISLYDRRSETVMIYDFVSQQLVKEISLKKVFKKRNCSKDLCIQVNSIAFMLRIIQVYS